MSLLKFLIEQMIILLLLMKYCRAGGTIYFKFVKFSNPGHQDRNGKKCDWSWGGGTRYCDYEFYIEICSDGCRSDYSKGRFTDYSSSTIYFSSYFGMHNPFTKSFYRYPGYVDVNVKIMDSDTTEANYDLVLWLKDTLRIPADGIWHEYHCESPYSRFDNHIKVKCDQNYYRHDCSRYCSPTRYYWCDSEGRKICRSGWRDSTQNCRLRDNCISNPCKNGGSCYNVGINSYSCNCDDNYYGRHCTKHCVSDEYSICNSSGQKSCRPGWRDLSRGCRLRDFCRSSPCKNNGKCMNNDDNTFSCTCPIEFIGQTCDLLGIEIYECDDS